MSNNSKTTSSSPFLLIVRLRCPALHPQYSVGFSTQIIAVTIPQIGPVAKREQKIPGQTG